MRTEKADPLYVIFEQHLYNFQDSDSDRNTFIMNILKEYLLYLRKMNIAVPRSLENSILEELYDQVNTMLLKKIYGSMTIQEYQQSVPVEEKQKVRTRYTKLAKKAQSE